MARQGLSAEPELIACAMSYCLRRPCSKPPPHLTLLLPTSILIFAPPPSSHPPFSLSLLHHFSLLLSLFPCTSYVLLWALLTSHTSHHLSLPAPPPSSDPPLHTQSPPASPQSAYSSRHSFAHSFTHSLVHLFTCTSFILPFNRHSFTGLPTRRGFIRGQLRHLRF